MYIWTIIDSDQDQKHQLLFWLGKHPMKFDLNACIDVSFARTLGKAIADAVLPGIGNIKESLAKAKEFFNNIGMLFKKL